MAHVGHNYKLHFRRDLVVGIPRNQASFAEAYLVGLQFTVLGNPGPPVQETNWLLPVNTENPMEPIWQGVEARNMYGHDVTLRMEWFDWVFERQVTRCKLYFHSEGEDRCYFIYETFFNDFGEHLVVPIGATEVFDFDEEFWGGTPGAFAGGMRAATWAVYP